MLRIHGIPRSRAFRCIWAAEEAGLPYEVVPIGFASGFKLERPLAINPNNKIPALEDGDLVLFESLAINLHIAKKAGAPLMPSGDDESRVLQWTLWTATEVEAHVLRWGYNTYLKPPAERVPAEASAGKEALDLRLAVLEGELAKRPFLLGEAFTIADLNLACVLYAARANGYDLARFPKVVAWIDACLDRPAARRARALREG
ncbi:glutathione S-transferase family protein [Roseomonas eburnea]|uniref:Glutathione S-transferase family protein n=1 Tax=Neoroseomonas eburnea TaxID=1346889 RepID=A0A9X9XKA3_9PROT|nr:glutathione S-transferase family protein [Neoroseomonas eburnea]MBR0684139.1 glutathione S-transferase family protein [Neoroseomonas eburnea]